ncbi:alpha-L-arabinofuranosidase C-terminal domain-containing protein [Paenibacillus sp. SAFN-054]|uniref:alpha-L-arabinofuranosidase C-terminal domain-containing protein n=2 Tax=unclassified Paenibacillus TaxID=185978 RepID=UPI003F7E4F76
MNIQMNEVIHTADAKIYGANNRFVNDGYGMWDPAAKQVFQNFDALYRQVGFGSIRYPAGTAANLFDWKRTIGPVEQRKKVIHGLPNSSPGLEVNFGVDEAAGQAEATGSSLIYMYNVGNGSAADAADLVEYLNAAAGTNPNGGIAWADVRALNGHPEPYHVGAFEIGNELYLEAQRYWTAGSGEGTYQQKYANGGEVSFTKQNVVMDEDWRASAALSDGAANQVKTIRYVPLKAQSVSLYVEDVLWNEVNDLNGQGSANVYLLDDSTGQITFGNGINGNIPPIGAKITASYTAIKDGFKDYVAAMKAVDPNVKVYSCLHDQAFFNAMGSFAYDGVAFHAYGSNNGKDSMEAYHDGIMLTAQNQVNGVNNMVNKMKSMNNNMDVVVTEYGIAGLSSQYKGYLNSTGQALYVAKMLMGLSKLDVSYANKHTLIDTIGSRDSVGVGEQAVIQRYVDGNGQLQDFVLSPVALTMELFNKNFGRNILQTDVMNNPAMNGNPTVKKLDILSSKDNQGNVHLMVANTDRLDDVHAVISLSGMGIDGSVQASTLASPEFNSRNTLQSPDNVRIETTQVTDFQGGTTLAYTFPKHSLTVLKMKPAGESSAYSFIRHKSSNNRLHALTGTADEVNLDAQAEDASVQWKFVDAGSGWVYIEQKGTGKRLHASTAQNWNVTLVDGQFTGDNVKWKLTDVDGTWKYMDHKASGKRLHASQTQSWEITLADRQFTGDNVKWKVEP